MIPTLGIYGIQDQGDYPIPQRTHDHAAALFQDGRLIWALELERYTRRKHDNRLHRFLEPLIYEGILPLPDRFRVVIVDSFVGRTFLSESGYWRVEGDAVPLSQQLPLQPARGTIGFDTVEAYHCSQELAHIGANLPFTGGFEDDSLLVHIDGGASQGNASAFHYKDGKIRYLYHGWDTVSTVLNFSINGLTLDMLGLDEDGHLAAPGRLMGYAAYGQDDPTLRHWLREHEWFRDHLQQPATFFSEARREFGWQADGLDLHDPFVMNIAACFQAAFEEQMLAFLREMAERTGARRIYLAGGALLNVELNRKILASGMFDKVYIPPCCSDCGLAIGAAALAEFLERGAVSLHSPFLNNAGLTAIGDWGRPLDISEIAERLANEQVVAVYTGAGEAGPRALGHRTLLASPVSTELRCYVSETIKRRQWYRPLAPIVLEEYAEDLFPGSTQTDLTDFMLSNVMVNPARRSQIPGVVHVDGTARVQVVRDRAPDLDTIRAILRAVRTTHGLPCLINTSFNGPDEPIIHTFQQAQEAARRLKIDALILDGRMEAYAPLDLMRWA